VLDRLEARKVVIGKTHAARACELLNWLAAGKTNGEIAALLAISSRTVQKHLQHIYEKLGVETRTAAVMRAMELVARQLT
jgi:DNA-binding CsgD family transcriptional regulator